MQWEMWSTAQMNHLSPQYAQLTTCGGGMGEEGVHSLEDVASMAE